MITKFILILIITSVLSFIFGVIYADKKHRQELIQYYEDLGRINTAWQTHCNAMREHYQNALMSKHGKCTCDEKVLYQGKHEIDPCAYKVKEKYHNVTIEVLECKKCGHTEISWYRQDDTEEVEVE